MSNQFLVLTLTKNQRIFPLLF